MFLLFQTFDFSLILLYFLFITYFPINKDIGYGILCYDRKDIYIYIYIKIYLISFPFIIKIFKKLKIFKLFLLRVLYIIFTLLLLNIEIKYISTFIYNQKYRILEIFLMPILINFILILLSKKINRERIDKKELKKLFYYFFIIVALVFLEIIFTLSFGN